MLVFDLLGGGLEFLAAIQAGTHTQDAGERRQVTVETAKNGAEKRQPRHKKGQQEGIQAMKLRIAFLVVPVKYRKPTTTNHPKARIPQIPNGMRMDSGPLW